MADSIIEIYSCAPDRLVAKILAVSQRANCDAIWLRCGFAQAILASIKVSEWLKLQTLNTVCPNCRFDTFVPSPELAFR
jgi:hypothetical protein